ncbi:undecaprenyl/decaprenyl-phosphate alpha-N-acetylglucosaminyl 1-phosphate transferase [Candidatus Gottesmanbacteria bacterium]|nr:undecaprenyl/decaprenyl-phosphate alpha-N-acetylglucosaminyl 1-phosphate transferase [Candidatus Gottesmanbacteria bacterium]
MPIFFIIPQNKIFWGIFAAALLIVVIGLWDDKKDRSPYTRFFLNFLVAAITVASGVGIPYITNPFGGVIHLDTWIINFDIFGPHKIIVWADIFALIWIVWCMNMVNWSKGVDGQMPGFVAISSLTIGILSLRFSQFDIAQINITYLAILTTGSFLGFLWWNFYPQKIMPGYGGGALAGFMLAVLSIFSYGKLGTMLLVLGVPVTDAIYTLVRRLFYRQSPFKPDKEHLHHKLLAIGWGKRRIAFFYWFISAVLGFIALNLSSKQKLFAFVLIGALIVGFIIWISRLSKIKGVEEEEI